MHIIYVTLNNGYSVETVVLREYKFRINMLTVHGNNEISILLFEL